MLSIAIISCSDSDKSVNQKLDGQPFTFGGSYTNLWNPANPLDSLGYIHNEIGDYVISQYVSSTGALLFKGAMVSHINDYTDSVYSMTLSQSDIDSTTLILQQMSDAIDSSKTFEDYLYEQFSSNIAYSLNELFQIVAACSTSNQVNATIIQIKSFENSIALNVSYPQHDKNVIFAASSISKFSLVYWDDAKNNTSNGWHTWKDDFEYEEEPEFIGWYEGIGAVLMDAITGARALDQGQSIEEAAARAATASLGILLGASGGIFSFIYVAVATLVSWFGG